MVMWNCEHCSNEYEVRGQGRQISARFCSDKCRYDASNEKRKLFRLAETTVKRIVEIQGIYKSTENKQNIGIAERLNEAIVIFAIHGDRQEFEDRVSAIKSRMTLNDWRLKNKPVTKWQCAKCGQVDSGILQPDKCSKCKHIAMLPVKPML